MANTKRKGWTGNGASSVSSRKAPSKSLRKSSGNMPTGMDRGGMNPKKGKPGRKGSSKY